MTTPEAALAAALQVLDDSLTGPSADADSAVVLAALHDAGWVLTPVAPEVPPRGLRSLASPDSALPLLDRVAGVIKNTPDGDPRDIADYILGMVETALAATRNPEPPDSGPRHIGDTDPSGNWDGSDDTGPEPPDSGDGGTRALHEGIEERLTMASDPFSRRESIHAYIDAWLESAGIDVALLREAARRVGLPPEVSVADIENLAAEYARLRAACRPCPEGGE